MGSYTGEARAGGEAADRQRCTPLRRRHGPLRLHGRRTEQHRAAGGHHPARGRRHGGEKGREHRAPPSRLRREPPTGGVPDPTWCRHGQARPPRLDSQEPGGSARARRDQSSLRCCESRGTQLRLTSPRAGKEIQQRAHHAAGGRRRYWTVVVVAVRGTGEERAGAAGKLPQLAVWDHIGCQLQQQAEPQRPAVICCWSAEAYVRRRRRSTTTAHESPAGDDQLPRERRHHRQACAAAGLAA